MDGETGGQTVEEICYPTNMQTQSGRRLTERPKNARLTLFMAIANFASTIAAAAAAVTMMAVQILTNAKVSPDDKSPVGDGFNRCNFNLLAFLDGTQSHAAPLEREIFFRQLVLWLKSTHFRSFCEVEVVLLVLRKYLLSLW